MQFERNMIAAKPLMNFFFFLKITLLDSKQNGKLLPNKTLKNFSKFGQDLKSWTAKQCTSKASSEARSYSPGPRSGFKSKFRDLQPTTCTLKQ